MTFELTIWHWAATLFAGGGVVLSLGVGARLLSRREGSRLANRSMGGLLVLAALAVLYVLLLGAQPPGEHLRLVFAPLAYTFALGPLLYTYVRARLGLGAPSPLHWVLPVAQVIVVLGIGLAPRAVQQWYMGAVFAPGWAVAQAGLAALSLAAYLALSWAVLHRTPPETAGWAEQRARWLRRLLAATTVVPPLLLVTDLVLPLAAGPGRPGWAIGAEALIYGGALYLAAFGGLVQADLRASAPEPRNPSPALAPGLAAAHRAALDTLVAEQRPYLDPDLTLGSLADQIGVTDKVLSALLNETLGTSYTDFINGLRVAEAQRRLASPEQAHLSVLAIGLDAGFASKSTFNRVFKETTGETPSAYRTRAAQEGRAIAS